MVSALPSLRISILLFAMSGTSRKKAETYHVIGGQSISNGATLTRALTACPVPPPCNTFAQWRLARSPRQVRRRRPKTTKIPAQKMWRGGGAAQAACSIGLPGPASLARQESICDLADRALPGDLADRALPGWGIRTGSGVGGFRPADTGPRVGRADGLPGSVNNHPMSLWQAHGGRTPRHARHDN